MADLEVCGHGHPGGEGSFALTIDYSYNSSRKGQKEKSGSDPCWHVAGFGSPPDSAARFRVADDPL